MIKDDLEAEKQSDMNDQTNIVPLESEGKEKKNQSKVNHCFLFKLLFILALGSV